MLRIISLYVLATGTFSAFAQTTPTIVKSDAVEMKSSASASHAFDNAASASVIGEVDSAPAHPDCASLTGQGRLDCSSEKVLAGIRTKLGTLPAPASNWTESPVTISFVVNQFGDMKDVRVEHFGDTELPKNIIVAMYDFPKFIPATKGSANTGATLRMGYRYGDLFTKP